MSSRPSAEMRRRVIHRAGNRCEYCLIHQVDAVGTRYEFLAEILDGDWKGRTEQTDLVFRIAIFDNLFQNGLKLR